MFRTSLIHAQRSFSLLTALLLMTAAPTAHAAFEAILGANGDGTGNLLVDAREVATDAAGNLYVRGAGSGNVFKVTPGGTVSEIYDAINGPSGFAMDAMAVDAAGNVYGCDTGAHLVFRVEADGSATVVMDATGDGNGASLDNPSVIETDSVGNLFVGGKESNNVLKLDSVTDEVSEVLNAAGAGPGRELVAPRTMIVDPSGNLYVAGEMMRNVLRVDPQGEVTEVMNRSGDRRGNLLDAVADLEFDAIGNLVVADDVREKLFRVSPNGSEMLYQSPVRVPTQLATDAVGNFYFVASQSRQVYRIRWDGQFDELVTPTASPGVPSHLAVGPNGDLFMSFHDETEGSLVVRMPAACSDGEANDSDGLDDFPNDPGCADANFPVEDPACNDGVDNDGDGQVDLLDADCLAASGLSEGLPAPGPRAEVFLFPRTQSVPAGHPVYFELRMNLADFASIRDAAVEMGEVTPGLDFTHLEYVVPPFDVCSGFFPCSPEPGEAPDPDFIYQDWDAGFDPISTGGSDITIAILVLQAPASAPLGETEVYVGKGISFGQVSGFDDSIEFTGASVEILAPACSDGVDNDGDGLVDLDDPNCNGNPLGALEGAACGLGAPELALLLPGLLWLRRRWS